MEKLDRLVNLKEIREQKGISQELLAKMSGVPRGTLANIESHWTEPRISTAVKIADCLNISLDELVGRERKEK